MTTKFKKNDTKFDQNHAKNQKIPSKQKSFHKNNHDHNDCIEMEIDVQNSSKSREISRKVLTFPHRSDSVD